MLPPDILEHTASIMKFGYIQKSWVAQHIEPVAKKNKLKLSDISLLYLLHLNKEFNTAKDVEKYSDLKRGNISLIVESLTCRGFLIQEQIEGDRRMKKLVLTSKCNPIFEECDEIVGALLKISLQGISEEELLVMKNCFKKMYRNMQNEEKRSLEASMARR
mgnify:FL=1